MIDFLIAATSTYSLARLTSDERESVKMTREALLWRLSARSGHSKDDPSNSRSRITPP